MNAAVQVVSPTENSSKKTEAAIFVSSQSMLNCIYNSYNKILLHRPETQN